VGRFNNSGTVIPNEEKIGRNLTAKSNKAKKLKKKVRMSIILPLPFFDFFDFAVCILS
jgi:hypothetical protein